MNTKKYFNYILKLIKKIKQIKIPFSLGLALLIFGGFLLIGFRGENKEFVDTFADEPVKVQGFSEIKNQEGDEQPLRIIIPEVQIDLEVKKAEVINGYWKVFQDSAGWGEGSGFPGKKGNQVIFAHARKGLFLTLNNIKKEDRIYVHTAKTWYEYSVVDIKQVTPNQIEVIAPTEDESLTLYTCSGYNDSYRLIIVAKRGDPLF